ncbi:Serine protease nudel [Anthophora plagiata]
MDTKCNISSSKLEKVPIIDSQCCVNVTPSKADIPTEGEKNEGNCSNWKLIKRYKLIRFAEFLIVLSILCLAGFMIYLTFQSDYVQLMNQTDQQTNFVIGESIQPKETMEPTLQNLYRYFYREELKDLSSELRSMILQIDRKRSKRDIETNPCSKNIDHCKTVINSMWSIVSIVNNSMPHLQALLRNYSTDVNASKSEFMELVECLQCKNDSTQFTNDTNTDSSMKDHRTMLEHSDHVQLKNNVDMVANLLNDEKENSTSSEVTTLLTIIETRVSIFDQTDTSRNEDTNRTKGSKEDEVSNKRKEEVETKSSTIRTTEYESTSTEAKIINAMTDQSSKAEGTTIETKRINDTTQSVVTVNVTAKPDESNVTEITNSAVHPSGQGLGEWNKTEREGENAPKGPDFPSIRGRIVSKVNTDTAPGIIPTAETIKSSQQMQLNPTMTWMPYQVCFYGPQANGPVKQQSSTGQIAYPSSPGFVYPMSMQQPRQGYPNSNQSPNYLQVQAQSVQILPMQSWPGNNGQPSGPKIGPTGPGTQNLPIFPGLQGTSSTGASSSAKTPYYCTYIPAPTFQFPTIPGVSEYQRSTTSEKKEETEHAMTDDKMNNKKIVATEYATVCPYNTIRCGDGTRCILRTKWCNGQVDCNDASDEITCSCRERISQERLCDGYFDCPHGEDELGCLGCQKTSFSCNDWQRKFTDDNCVPLSQRCDGVTQCANGKDEMDCNILTSSYIEGKNVFSIGFIEGYLHKNYKGQWYPVCTATDLWAKEACNSEIGPEINSKPEIEIHSVPETAYTGPYLAEVNGEIQVVPSCMNTAVFVRCPRFPCGTRVLSHEDSLQPVVLEKENQNPLQAFDEFPWMFTDVGRNNRNKISEQDDMVASQLRIVGGRASQPKAWPFLVAIYKDGNFYCGGVILNELWVLTAAHCLDRYVGHYFEIQAGMLRRFSFSPMAQVRKARYTVIHPRYSSSDMSSDIGMIMLDDALRFNRWVRPVCLPSLDILGSLWRLKPDANTTCVAIGWGIISERGPDPDHLREVEVPILPTCKHEVDKNEATICAGYPQGGRDACQGDSGGPLLCRNPYQESQWYVAGIVSHGEGCGRPDEPGSYTKVSYFLDWIQEIISGRGVPPLKRTPLEKCPGFSCEGGLGKCLPIEARCNRMIDCLDGEDEVNCIGRYPLYRQLDESDLKVISTIELDNSTIPDKVTTTDSVLTDTTTDKSYFERKNNHVQSENDNNSTSTTHSPDGTEIDSTSTIRSSDRTKNDLTSTTDTSDTRENNLTEAATVFPKIFTCTRMLQSIPIEKRCNRKVDCEDGTDEMNCTCKDILLNVKPSAICDGYTDCNDQTDEKNCTFCAEDEFFCKTSRICISMSKKCDANFDCEYKEDEIDCYTLSDGEKVYLDADERPFLNMQGVLTRYFRGKWQPTCHRPRMHRNQSTATLIGQNMCEYFGFANLESSESVAVKNSEVETIEWHRRDSSAASLNEKDETCPGLYIRCTPVLSGSVSAHLVIDTNTGKRDYLWPWLAAIFVDGRYRCSALLLDHNWLLSTAKCIENIRLDKNYTTAVLGYGPLFRHIDGPYQQVTIIDEIHSVNNSVSILLHLKDRVNFSRHVKPLFHDKKIYLPGVDDTCIAIGTNENYETRSVFLRPILQNCQSCQRCFVNASNSECSGSETSDWSGMIFCRGRKGWYPTAVFQDNKGVCTFKTPQTMTSIDLVNPYLIEAMDGPRQPIEPVCNGFQCNIGQCIPQNRVCDGIPDCRDRTDENLEYCGKYRENCENTVEGCSCTKTELRCRNGRCVDKSAFCDGSVDCSDKSDEPNICTCAEYLKLTAPERLCDGVRHCLDKTDELPEVCPCKSTSFQCETTNGNNTCIPQDFVCDDDKDCLYGEDEATCRMLKQSSNNSSGEVFRRSYGVWYTECLPNPLSSEEDASNICKSMGYSSGSISNDTIIIDEPMIPKRDDFYMVRINNWVWMSIRDDKPLLTLEKSNETCNRAFVDCI